MLGPRDKLTSSYTSACVLVVLHTLVQDTLRAMILLYYYSLVVFPKIHRADSRGTKKLEEHLATPAFMPWSTRWKWAGGRATTTPAVSALSRFAAVQVKTAWLFLQKVHVGHKAIWHKTSLTAPETARLWKIWVGEVTVPLQVSEVDLWWRHKSQLHPAINLLLHRTWRCQGCFLPWGCLRWVLDQGDLWSYKVLSFFLLMGASYAIAWVISVSCLRSFLSKIPSSRHPPTARCGICFYITSPLCHVLG